MLCVLDGGPRRAPGQTLASADAACFIPNSSRGVNIECAVATSKICLRGPLGMIILLVLVCGVVLVWLIYKMTIYALPFSFGLAAGRWAFETGGGWLGSFAVCGVVALAVFLLMRWLYAVVNEPVLRTLLSVIFGAGVAGLIAFVRLAEADAEF